MKNKLKLLAMGLVLAAVGFQLGHSLASQARALTQASSESPTAASAESVNDIAKLFCPSEQEFLDFAAEVKLVLPKGPSLDAQCDDGSRARLAKVLALLKRLKLRPPQNWPDPMRSDVADGFTFLKNSVTKLFLNLDLPDVVARNAIVSREIELGGQFFVVEPLEALSFLIHEARHSAGVSTRHEMCDSGDYPRQQMPAACDAQFGLEDNVAMAYSYQVLFDFAIALYGEQLAESDRKFMLSSGLVYLGTRFNKLPETLARKVDVLAVLESDGTVRLIHPFARHAKTLALKFESEDERPTRIEFATAANGLAIYTNKNRAWTLAQTRQFGRFFGSAIPSEYPVAEVSPLRLTSDGVVRFTVRTPDDDLKYIDFNTDKKRNELYTYRLDLGKNASFKPPIARMFITFIDDSTFLGRDGIYYLGMRYGDEDVFRKLPELQSNNGWISATGGLLYDFPYLIDRLGQLSFGSLTFESHPNYDEFLRHYKIEPSNLVHSGPLKKFQQGFQVQIALAKDGAFWVWKYGDPMGRRLDLGSDIVDFAILHHSEAFGLIGETAQPVQSFRQACGIERLVTDPWFARGLGYDSLGEATAAGERDGECVPLGKKNFSTMLPYYDHVEAK